MPESQKKSTTLQVKTVQASIAYHRWKFYAIKVLMYYTSLINVDEFAIEVMREYEGKPFHSISRGDLDLDDVESQRSEKKKTETIAKIQWRI